MNYKITHLTSAHPRYDTRIFIKECTSLAKAENYEVRLIVADGLGDEVKNSINIYDVGKIEGRVNRILKTTKRVLEKAIELDSDIYHLHDPELMPVGLKLKRMGKKVIFDAHEDLPKQVMAKEYIPIFIRKILSFVLKKYEKRVLKKFDFVVGATPIIRDKFLSYDINAMDVNNFPILDEFLQVEPKFETNNICYIGTLYPTRGIEEIVKAIDGLDVTLIIAGAFQDKLLEQKVKQLKSWKQVDYRGFVNRVEIAEILDSSLAGLVTLHPTSSYLEAYPVKMFEYMAANLPVISSDFPLYAELLENAGILVNPLAIEEIRKAIQKIILNKKEAREIGNKGRKRVIEKFNWAIEEKKLYLIYKEQLCI